MSRGVLASACSSDDDPAVTASGNRLAHGDHRTLRRRRYLWSIVPTAALVAAACGSGSDDSGADARSESTEIRSTPATTTTTPAPTTSTTSTTTSTTSTSTSTTVAASTTTVASSRDPEQTVADWISNGVTAEEVECLSGALNTQGWDTVDNVGMFLPIALNCGIGPERLAILGLVTKFYGEPISALDVGDCVNGTGFDDPPPLSNPGELTYADCNEPHDLEVFHLEVIDQSPEATYPGGDAVRMLADEVCLENFEAYVGVDYDESPLGYFYSGPTEADWQSETPVRGIVCFLYDPTLESLPPPDPQT